MTDVTAERAGVQSTPDFSAQIDRDLPGLLTIRARLHRTPEVGLALPETQRIVAEQLRAIGLTPVLGKKLSSVSAVLRGGKPGPVVLLRADMDALPIREPASPHAATNGAMHACGHDLHMAGLIGAARALAANAAQLRGSVILMFQPGEEGHGGAQLMLDEGVLELAGRPITAAYGLHVLPTGTVGTVTVKAGTIMAGSSRARIIVRGRGAHASAPELGADPVPPLAQIVLGLQSLITRSFSAQRPIVVTVTQLAAGTSVNVIAEESSCWASIRTTSPEDEAALRERIERLVRDTASAADCVGSVEWQHISGPVQNDPERTTALSARLRDALGKDRVLTAEEPLMASEDFSAVLDAVPGSFFFVSARNPDQAPGALHTSDVEFDPAAIATQALALATAAWGEPSEAAQSAPDQAGGAFPRETAPSAPPLSPRIRTGSHDE